MTVLDRVPIDRINVEARAVKAGRVILTILAGLLYVIGWTAALSWRAVVWACVAVKVGWADCRKVRTDGSS